MVADLFMKVTVFRNGEKLFSTTFQGTDQEYLDGCVGPNSVYGKYEKDFPTLGNRRFWRLLVKPQWMSQFGPTVTLVACEG